MELSDLEIIERCIKGEKDLFEILISRYKKLVYKIVYGMLYNKDEIPDAAQEVFIRVYKNLDKYNPEYKFSTWIIKITTNFCLDLNKKKKLDCFSIDETDYLMVDENTPENQYFLEEKKRYIAQSINELPEKYRTPIILFHKNNLSYEDISATINRPITIVKNRLHRARKMLKEKLASIRKE